MTDRSMRRAVDMSLLFTALALIAGGIIASVGLARDSLWLDETYTWLFVRSTWPDLLTSTRIVAVHPPLYYILVKALVGSGPLTEVALRFPSVIFHLIGITGAASIGAILGGRTGRVAAAWMWALHPMAIWYAREARPYALAAALAAITLACYLRAERQGSLWTWALGGVSMAAGLVTHARSRQPSDLSRAAAFLSFLDPPHAGGAGPAGRLAGLAFPAGSTFLRHCLDPKTFGGGFGTHIMEYGKWLWRELGSRDHPLGDRPALAGGSGSHLWG
jgi:hypothetical protein